MAQKKYKEQEAKGNSKPKFIIEHLEPRLYHWCEIEYKNASSFVGKNNIAFTNIKNNKEITKLKKLGALRKESIAEFCHILKDACILDPKAKKELTPAEAKHFDCFIFGGILGDYPAGGRTSKLLTEKLKGLAARNLGKKQLPTDMAVLVTKLILYGKRIKDIKFKDKLKIKIRNGKFVEEIILPFRYPSINGKLLISKELIKYLKKKKTI